MRLGYARTMSALASISARVNTWKIGEKWCEDDGIIREKWFDDDGIIREKWWKRKCGRMCELTSGKGGSYLSQVYVLRGGGRVCGKVGERDG